MAAARTPAQRATGRSSHEDLRDPLLKEDTHEIWFETVGDYRTVMRNVVQLWCSHYTCDSNGVFEEPKDILRRFKQFCGTLEGLSLTEVSGWGTTQLMPHLKQQLDTSRLKVEKKGEGGRRTSRYKIVAGSGIKSAFGMLNKVLVDKRRLARLEADQKRLQSAEVQQAIAAAARAQEPPSAAPSKTAGSATGSSSSSSSSSSSAAAAAQEKEEEENKKRQPGTPYVCPEKLPYLGQVERSLTFKSIVRDVVTRNPGVPHRKVGEIFCMCGAALVQELGLQDQVPLERIVELAPSAMSVAKWLKTLGDHDEKELAEELEDIPGVYVLLDSGQKKQRELCAFLAAFWDKHKKRVQLKFLEILPLDDKTSAAAASALNKTTGSFLPPSAEIFGTATDSAADVISGLPRILKGQGHSLFHASGCLLHILNLVLATPTQLIFGEPEMGKISVAQAAYSLSKLVLARKEDLAVYCTKVGRMEMFFQVSNHEPRENWRLLSLWVA